MRLAAIYIEDHEYLFEEPQTINFGGQYFYVFENLDNKIYITKTLNEKFIPDFFNLTNLQSKVTNLNAIVGQNGAGKSTILDIIRSKYVINGEGLPYSKSLFLYEQDGTKNPIISKNNFESIYILNNQNEEPNEIKNNSSEDIQTIYYSPHFDYKYNPNFSNIDNHDISFDKILENDLKVQNSENRDVNGSKFSAIQELLFANSQRQILFLNSELVSSSDIFKGLFQFQNHYNPVLHFRTNVSAESFWNTPRNFRPILKLIKEKIKEESDQWGKYGDSGKTKIEVLQYILKRRVLDGILSILIEQMERRNSFLEEGFYDLEKYKKEVDKLSSTEIFLHFIKNGYIKIRNSAKVKIINESLFNDLLNSIYLIIENVRKKEDITNSSIKVSVEEAIVALNLQRQFLIDLSTYYTKFYADKSDLTNEYEIKINGFVSYMPFDRRMSSGETALLNFYSRIYDFLNTNLKEVKLRKLANHYILLLDEADLTFHIKWKKKYVKALLSTLPYFFEELENKPTIEIIFTTHDPITLSDIPNSNVIYIERTDYDSPSVVLDFKNDKRPSKTFGANISELIADSFFIDESLIGNFVFDKIQETIKWLKSNDNLEKKLYYKALIQIINEPIIQRKLAEMYDDKTQDNFQADVIDEQIKKLQELKKRLGE